jgi:hypothetical protein
VLDQGSRAELLVRIEDEAAHILFLLELHAGHRLINGSVAILRLRSAA